MRIDSVSKITQDKENPFSQYINRTGLLAVYGDEEWIVYDKCDDTLIELGRIDGIINEFPLNDSFALTSHIDISRFEVKAQIIHDIESSNELGNKEKIKNCLNSVLFVESIDYNKKNGKKIYHLHNNVFHIPLYESDIQILGIYTGNASDKSFELGEAVVAIRNHPCHDLVFGKTYRVVENNILELDKSCLYLIDVITKERLITKKKFVRKYVKQ